MNEHHDHHHHRGGAGGFDLGCVVPGLAFFEELAGNLCHIAVRALELTGEAYRGAQRRLARNRARNRDEVARPD